MAGASVTTAMRVPEATVSTSVPACARGLAAPIGRHEACHRFERPRFLLFRRRPAQVELLWMPFFLVTLELGEGDERAALHVLVDGRSGHAVRLEGEVAWQPTVPLLAVPLLGETEALQRARTLLRRGLLLRRGRSPVPLAPAGQRAELVAYPFWMQVFERRAGRFDVRLLDAVGGRRAGADTRRAVLSALAEESRRELASSPPAVEEATS